MSKDGRIFGYDLVNVWKYKSQLETEKAMETMRAYIALAVGSFVALVLWWLS